MKQLAGHTQNVLARATDLVSFCERDPGLAAAAGLETCALEARMTMGAPGVRRLLGAAPWAKDMEIVSRLEAVLATASRRVKTHLTEMESEDLGRRMRHTGETLFLATAVLGVVGALA